MATADKSISVEPCAALIGAVVSNVSLNYVPTFDTVEAIETALEQYGVLVFPQQSLTPNELIAFSRSFADLELTELSHAQLQGHNEIFVVGNTGEALVTFSPADSDGELEWHTDHIHREVPARASLLYALEVPEEGGDTLFACMYSAYDALTPQQQAAYAQLEIETSAWGLERYLEKEGHSPDNASGRRRNYTSVLRPLVREHPRSSRRALYFGNQVSVQVKGWSEAASRTFIEQLTDHACRPSFRYRHKWSIGDAVLWDNRRVLHAGTPYDTRNTRRRMYRTTWRETETV